MNVVQGQAGDRYARGGISSISIIGVVLANSYTITSN